MKRIITLSFCLSLFFSSFANANLVLPKENPKIDAKAFMVPIGKNGEKVSLKDLSEMSTKNYEQLTGKKMNLAKKLEFKLIQRNLRNTISDNGTIKTKILGKALVKAKRANAQTHKYLKLWLILLGLAIVFGLLGWVTGFFWILSTIAGIGAVVFFILWLISMSGSM